MNTNEDLKVHMRVNGYKCGRAYEFKANTYTYMCIYIEREIERDRER